MKKLLIGLATGFALGAGIFYTPKHQQKMQPGLISQSPCELTHTNTAPYLPKKNNHDNAQLEKINLTDESLKQYGEQLYKEMYNGECIELNKFLEAKDQISSIYKEYGFEKAKVLYSSLRDKLSEFKGNSCDFNLESGKLIISSISSLPLEDFMKLLYYHGSFTGEDEMKEYLHSQNKETREEYINRICENQENAFLNPTESKYPLCWRIAISFPEEVLNSTSIAQEVPEMPLTSEYLDSLESLQLKYEGTDLDRYNDMKQEVENLKKEFVRKIANITCERYNSYLNSESGIKEVIALERFVELTESNMEIPMHSRGYCLYGNNTFTNIPYLGYKVKNQCGKKE